MNRIILLHLTFVGPARPPASVVFSPKLTVIYGASDTGKSFIVEALDFVLGGKRLKKIPEADGYSQVLLGLKLSDDSEITLSRPLNGGSINLYRRDIRVLPTVPADKRLSPKHSSEKDTNISRVLLKEIGLDGAWIRTNSGNQVQPLSFRNIAHLCIVSETQMQAQQPPALPSGQHVSRTAEKSALKVVIQGEDDSSLLDVITEPEKKVNKGKIELLDSLVEELKVQLSTFSDVAELKQQLSRLQIEIESQTAEIGSSVSRRSEAVARRAVLADAVAAEERRLSEVRDLLARFALLRAQYDSDLARLETIREAGSILGFFSVGVCVFCGADPEHQDYAHMEIESTHLHEAVETEQSKTENLRADLLSTIEDLQQQEGALRVRIGSLSEEAESVSDVIASIDAALNPLKNDLTELTHSHSNVEKAISLCQQLDRLASLRAELMAANEGDKQVIPGSISDQTWRSFSETVRRVLGTWQIREADTVGFDRENFDLIVGGRPRSSRGKGVRAILHAAFTSSLAQYCFERDLPHPGFVVLDSPVVTFREPEPDDEEAQVENEVSRETVTSSFYRFMNSTFSGQAVILENIDPPDGLVGEATLTKFTKITGLGRYGFFPNPS